MMLTIKTAIAVKGRVYFIILIIVLVALVLARGDPGITVVQGSVLARQVESLGASLDVVATSCG
jgi:hypothetical protein